MGVFTKQFGVSKTWKTRKILWIIVSMVELMVDLGMSMRDLQDPKMEVKIPSKIGLTYGGYFNLGA